MKTAKYWRLIDRRKKIASEINEEAKVAFPLGCTIMFQRGQMAEPARATVRDIGWGGDRLLIMNQNTRAQYWIDVHHVCR